ncbi:unnamed protein product [Ectocarpus sp. 6 AP-2014]
MFGALRFQLFGPVCTEDSSVSVVSLSFLALEATWGVHSIPQDSMSTASNVLFPCIPPSCVSSTA